MTHSRRNLDGASRLVSELLVDAGSSGAQEHDLHIGKREPSGTDYTALTTRTSKASLSREPDMNQHSRREFLGDVGKGMIIASVGYGTAFDLGLTPAFADDGSDSLRFGKLEPLVCLMQETPIDRLLPKLVEQLNAGTDLGELVKAAALANARTFGGEDYIGFHTMMALAPDGAATWMRHRIGQ